MRARLCDELDFAFGWIAEQPRRLERTSHALAADGKVWIVDPVAADGVEERFLALGDPAAVVQLLDRHSRDCAPVAAHLGVPHYAMPFAGVPGSPFEVLAIMRTRVWREVALWWRERAVLVCGDAVGTARYYRAPGERLAVHPLLRLVPPRRLAELTPRHVLTGHGAGIHGDEAMLALREALASSRRRLPRWLLGLGKKEEL